MRVVFVLTNPVESPGERFRILQFLPHFERAGVECGLETFFHSPEFQVVRQDGFSIPKAFSIARAGARRWRERRTWGSADIAVIYRQPADVWPGKTEKTLERAGIPFVFDFDDAIYLPGPGSPNTWTTVLRPPGATRRTIARAAKVVAGNDTLADYARALNPNVQVIPTCLDTDVYRPVAEAHRAEEVVIGWIGSPSTAAYLDEIREALAEVRRRHPEALVRIVGSGSAPPVADGESLEWSLATEASDIQGFDIGIMPLTDDDWARAKCGLKVLQYMAVGIPVVASSVGAGPRLIEEGITGFLAADPQQWVAALSRLVADRALRARLGAEGRRHVERDYSLAKWAPEYLAVLESVYRDRIHNVTAVAP